MDNNSHEHIKKELEKLEGNINIKRTESSVLNAFDNYIVNVLYKFIEKSVDFYEYYLDAQWRFSVLKKDYYFKEDIGEVDKESRKLIQKHFELGSFCYSCNFLDFKNTKVGNFSYHSFFGVEFNRTFYKVGDVKKYYYEDWRDEEIESIVNNEVKKHIEYIKQKIEEVQQKITPKE